MIIKISGNSINSRIIKNMKHTNKLIDMVIKNIISYEFVYICCVFLISNIILWKILTFSSLIILLRPAKMFQRKGKFLIIIVRQIMRKSGKPNSNFLLFRISRDCSLSYKLTPANSNFYLLKKCALSSHFSCKMPSELSVRAEKLLKFLNKSSLSSWKALS